MLLMRPQRKAPRAAAWRAAATRYAKRRLRDGAENAVPLDFRFHHALHQPVPSAPLAQRLLTRNTNIRSCRAFLTA